MNQNPELTHDDCIDSGDDRPGHECRGEVHYRMNLSGTGVNHPRCDAHWERRLDRQEEINRDYPDSPIAPAWFDPTAAGEVWDEGDY